MGVPAFFRWLSKKYPSIVVHCVEEKPKEINGVKIPVDSSQPNPNNFEFDNLYLDMNGIIHPCCHPEDKPAPKNEDEMMVAIFEYIDRLFSIVRPRKLLYMAIDGVAPRAKMNQQRSRRFRASKETEEKITEIARIRGELLSKGAHLPPEKPKEDHFDSNCITPGTPFMDRLAKCLHYYIHDRLNSDPGWKNISVILSDANVPGEGEHKIMDYIRRQRANPDHDPNTHHCLCGADADLIMLGLATHEPNFTIIREEFKPNQPRPCEICGQVGHEMKDCVGAPKDCEEIEKPLGLEVQFIYLRLNILREYLERELVMHNLPFEFEMERALDDWVFMCFFVGNDFLPHLPSLEIRENAIDRLITLYKKAVHKTGGYLTNSGLVNLHRVQLIMTDLGEVEDEIFKRRQENELAFRQRQKDRKKRMKSQAERPAWIPGGQFTPTALGSKPSPVQNARKEAYQMRMQGFHSASSQNSTGASGSDGQKRGTKRKSEEMVKDSDEEEEPQDDVRLWEDGWKDRYYENKFDVSADNIEFRQKVAEEYTKGLCWVLRYYYQGCASWKWYFPYHYAPFASDFINIGDLSTEFEKHTKPFNPLEQLMGVFPAASKQHLPEPWGYLMCEAESPIIDFYPVDFKIDLNGKKYAWQGVALLPFVDEKRLLKALENVYPMITVEEKRRNIRGDDRLYIGKNHNGFNFLCTLYEGERDFKEEMGLDTKLFNGIGGRILLSDSVVEPGGLLQSPIPCLVDLRDNQAVCIRFRDPKYDEDFIFPAKRLPGAIEPDKVLKPSDLSPRESRNWRPQIGMSRSNQRAYLDSSGFRKLGHAGQGTYSNMAPPRSLTYDTSRSGRNYGQGGWQRESYQPYDSRSRDGGNSGGGGSGWRDGHRKSYSDSSSSGYSRSSYSQDAGNSGGWSSSRRPENSRQGFGYSSSSSSGGGGGGGGGGSWNRGGAGSYDNNRNNTNNYGNDNDNWRNRDDDNGRYQSYQQSSQQQQQYRRF